MRAANLVWTESGFHARVVRIYKDVCLCGRPGHVLRLGKGAGPAQRLVIRLTNSHTPRGQSRMAAAGVASLNLGIGAFFKVLHTLHLYDARLLQRDSCSEATGASGHTFLLLHRASAFI